MIKKKPILLSPAGTLEGLKTAILYGADAVYCGLPTFSLRKRSGMTLEDIKAGVKFVHNSNKKIYIALNLFAQEKDFAVLPKTLELIGDLNVDGIIIADPAIFDLVKTHLPNIDIHISTQANVNSSLGVHFWKKMGATLCVLAREVSFEEFKEIRRKCPDIKLEIFVHGAMCMAYSGRCLLSNFMEGRFSNKGHCSNECRKKYTTYIKREDSEELYPLIEDDDTTQRGSSIMNSKDLCLMPHIKEIIESGVDAVKIEGRTKSEYYVGLTTYAYRQAIDSYFNSPVNFDFKPFMKILDTLQNRGYTTAFFNNSGADKSQFYDSTSSISSMRVVGVVNLFSEEGLELILKNYVEIDDIIHFIVPRQNKKISIKLERIINYRNKKDVEKLSAGADGASIFIPFSIFTEQLDISTEDIKKLLPTLTLAQKEFPLTDLEEDFLSRRQKEFIQENKI
ncbi:MAG: U32 family peptidase [Alphaproteobacteria bacterium]|nr:U32 family peptidase [Alphaproteobacteria bacterium]MBL0717733.1 U32 family peptidase [Alphaproteobacteria bacterium]